MNTRRFYLLFLLFFLSNFNAGAAEPTYTPEGIDQNEPLDPKKFEHLMQKALKAKGPSVPDRATLGTLRILLKSSDCFILFIPIFSGTKFNKKYLLFIIIAIILKVILYDKLVFKKDKFLTSLKKLHQYLFSLNKKQRKDLKVIFKEKYETLLNKKVSKEKDGTIIKFGIGLETSIDLLLNIWAIMSTLNNNIHPQNWNIQNIKTKFSNLQESEMWANLSNVVLTFCLLDILSMLEEILQLGSKFENPNDQKKALLLKKIKRELE